MSSKKSRPRKDRAPRHSSAGATPEAVTPAEGPHRAARAAPYLGPLVILTALTYMLVISWGRWPDVLVDFGKELYFAWQLSEGKVLYRDLAHFLGPLSPYVNALWFKLFGVSFLTIVLCNLVILLGIMALFYRLLVDISTRFAATVALVVFVFTCACSQFVEFGNYNYICPNTHENSHGMLLALLALFGFSRWVTRGQRRRDLVLCGLALGCTLLTRPTALFASGLAVGSGLLLFWWVERRDWRALLRELPWLVGATGVPLLVAVVCLMPALGLGDALRSVLGPWLMILDGDMRNQPFYRAGMGLDHPGYRLGEIVAGLWKIGGAVAVFAGVSWGAARWPGQRAWIASGAFLVTVLALLLFWARPPEAWLPLLRPLPILLAPVPLASLLLLIRHRQRPPGDARWLLSWTLGIFSIAMLGKMLLYVRIENYGYFLAAPGLLLLVVLLVHWIPRVLDGVRADGAVFASMTVAAVVVWIGAMHALASDQFDLKTHEVGSGRDRFLARGRGERFLARGRGERVQHILERLEAEAEPGDTLAVLPEGVMLNFLARRANPTPYTNFMPIELDLFGEEIILAAFQEHPPDFIVITHKNTAEFAAYDENGRRPQLHFFGRDYGRALAHWIVTEYEHVLRAGAAPLTDSRFGMDLLRRKQ